MDNATAMDVLLANACPVDFNGDNSYTFELDLCCTVARVTASLVSTVGRIQYEVISLELV